MLVDVHAHLSHEAFSADLPAVIARAEDAGLGAIIVNGLEPISNRFVLDLAAQYPIVKPALGIYPIDAVADILTTPPYPLASFDVQAEIAFIAEAAASGRIIAVGECGLDAHWVKDETILAAQEKIFLQLVEIAERHNIPVIIHTRRREARTIEILAHHGVRKVDFHCFGGRSKLAIQAAEKHGWYFSIPANCRVNESFQNMLRLLPLERILTETDCPYLSPERGTRNEPRHVAITIAMLAELRSIDADSAKALVWQNYQALFGEQHPRVHS